MSWWKRLLSSRRIAGSSGEPLAAQTSVAAPESTESMSFNGCVRTLIDVVLSDQACGRSASKHLAQGVVVIAEPGPGCVLSPGQFLSDSTQISAPSELLGRAEDRVGRRGEFAALAPVSAVKFPPFETDAQRNALFEAVAKAWAGHMGLKAHYWRAYFELSGMNVRYSVLAVFDQEAEFMHRFEAFASLDVPPTSS